MSGNPCCSDRASLERQIGPFGAPTLMNAKVPGSAIRRFAFTLRSRSVTAVRPLSPCGHGCPPGDCGRQADLLQPVSYRLGHTASWRARGSGSKWTLWRQSTGRRWWTSSRPSARPRDARHAPHHLRRSPGSSQQTGPVACLASPATDAKESRARSSRIEDVALAHDCAPISMHIRYRQSCRRWRAKPLTQS